MSKHHARLPTEADEKLGLYLRRMRRSFDVTQSEMAKILGVSTQQYQKYEKGRNRISASKLFEICSEFGVEPNIIYAEAFLQRKT